MKLIDSDAFVEFIEKVYRPLCDDYHMKGYVLNQLLHDIENESGVEAIPIPFIKLQKDVLRSLIECSDSSKEIFVLSKKHEALEELLKDWSEHESKA